MRLPLQPIKKFLPEAPPFFLLKTRRAQNGIHLATHFAVTDTRFVMHYQIATFLDPRYKNYFFNEQLSKKIQDGIKHEIVEVPSDQLSQECSPARECKCTFSTQNCSIKQTITSLCKVDKLKLIIFFDYF